MYIFFKNHSPHPCLFFSFFYSFKGLITKLGEIRIFYWKNFIYKGGKNLPFFPWRMKIHFLKMYITGSFSVTSHAAKLSIFVKRFVELQIFFSFVDLPAKGHLKLCIQSCFIKFEYTGGRSIWVVTGTQFNLNTHNTARSVNPPCCYI